MIAKGPYELYNFFFIIKMFFLKMLIEGFLL